MNAETFELAIRFPKQLGERNEDGYRLEIESETDLAKASELMIRKSIADNFPRQLILFTKADSHFRVLLGIYPDAEKDENLEADLNRVPSEESKKE